MALSKSQIARYSRQLILPQIGVSGQQKLLDASVLIVGAGGLGSPVAFYLAAAGVGRIGIIDHDVVAPSNLHRQIIHTTSYVGIAKAYSAQATLHALNPDIVVEPIQQRLGADNALAILPAYDLIVDGSDNFTTRYLVNDACVLLGKPLVYGGVVGFSGQVMVIRPKASACFRCVFPEPPQTGNVPNCQEAGVVGAAAGVVGSLMAQEAIKGLVGAGEGLTNRLFVYDGLRGKAREVEVRRNAACAVCGDHPTIRELVSESNAACAAALGEERWQESRSR